MVRRQYSTLLSVTNINSTFFAVIIIMIKHLQTFLLTIVLTALLASCSSSKTMLPYFTDLSAQREGTIPSADYLPTIQPDDELVITVTSEYPAATTIYNLMAENYLSRENVLETATPRTATYVVDSKGDIDFPVLGKIHVAGKTCEQIKNKLTERIGKDVNDPLVNVMLVNFKVVVAGEVKEPKTIPVAGNRITLLDALAEAGDLTEYGERSNVLIIREENGERKFAHLDLNSSDVLTSPYYYLQQNDYIYVAPNSIRQANSKYNQNNAYKLSVTSTIVSAASVIASLVIALTVK